MKKLLTLSLLATLASGAAFASNHEGEGHKDKGYKGKKIEKMIEKMDTNKDGEISKDEFTAHHEKKFNEMDTNKDGKVSKQEGEEFYKAMKEKREKMKKEKGEHAKEHEGHDKNSESKKEEKSETKK